MSIRDKVINEIIEIEGGYVDNPHDSGGPTKYGITEKVARANGWTFPIKDLPRSIAFKIYENKYWNSLRLDDIEALSPMIAQEIVDTGVNAGVGRAAEFLQESLNVLNNMQKFYPDIVQDGAVGKATIEALRAYLKKRGFEGEQILYRMLNCLQGAFYVKLAGKREKDETFIYGWFKNRVQ